MHFPSTLQSLCYAVLQSFSLCFHSRLLIFPPRPHSLKPIRLPHDSPQASEGSFHARPECALLQTKQPRSSTISPIPVPDFGHFFLPHFDASQCYYTLSTYVDFYLLDCGQAGDVFNNPGGLEGELGPNTSLAGAATSVLRELAEDRSNDSHCSSLTSGEPESKLGLEMWDANKCLPTPWL